MALNKLVDAQVMGRQAPDCLLRSSDLLHAVLNKAPDNKKLVSVSIIECAEAALEVHHHGWGAPMDRPDSLWRNTGW
jgi:hypothetical protein